MNEPIIDAKGISKEYRTLHVLENINLQIFPDEVVALIGPSGCGKSTLMRILAGLLDPTSGEVYTHGKKLDGLLPGMSMVFQTFALYPWMTVRENIEIVLKAAHVSVDDMKKRTQDVINMIGLEEFADSYPREISGGMKQRVGMARALCLKPEILFMDEPFSELDTITAEILRAQVIDLWKKEESLSAILISSHDLDEVIFMADRIIILEKHPGKVHTVIENLIPRENRQTSSEDFLKLRQGLHDIYTQIYKNGSKAPH
jgi:NitT/TauT family transport system ATP-binding protein